MANAQNDDDDDILPKPKTRSPLVLVGAGVTAAVLVAANDATESARAKRDDRDDGRHERGCDARFRRRVFRDEENEGGGRRGVKKQSLNARGEHEPNGALI